MHMRIAIVHCNDGSDVRISKTCRSLSSIGHKVHFIGCDRRPNEAKTLDLGDTTLHIMKRATRFGRGTLFGQVVFAIHTTRILAKIRPQTVCGVNEEVALLLMPLRGILYRHLVCDVFDSLVDRHSRCWWVIRIVLRVVSELGRTGADRLIATDQARFERFGRYRRKTIIIENFPEDPGDELALRLPIGPIKIYVGGSLSLRRGLEQIIKVAERVEDLEIVSAGWPYDDYAYNTFVQHPKVSFKGIVTSQQSLELAAGCDAVLAFYSPTSINNLYASPNKIYDAMSVGRPTIINSEVKIAKWVAENKVGWLCPYHDTVTLEKILSSLRERRANLSEFARNVRKIFLQGHNWGTMESRLKSLYQQLAGVSS